MMQVIKKTSPKAHLWINEPTRSNKSIELSARIETPGLDSKKLWFRLPREHHTCVTESADPFLIGTLFFAMRRGTDLHVHGTVSPSLIRNLEEFQAVWNCWLPDRYCRVAIQADNECEEKTAKIDSAVMTFSGGLDSSFTAWRHARGVCGRRRRNIATALMVHGFDIPLREPEVFNRALENSRQIVASIGLELIPLSYNFRELDDNWEQAHGAALASSLHLIRRRFSAGLIASSHTYNTLRFPWGSNPLTDEMFSTSGFSIVYDGAEFSRIEKAREIAGWEEAMKRIRVCWEGEHKDKNCGTCVRCVGTAICFAAEGAKIPESLSIASLAKAIGGLHSVSLQPLTVTRLEELLEAAKASKIEDSWVAVLERCVRYHRGAVASGMRMVRRGLRKGLRRFLASSPGIGRSKVPSLPVRDSEVRVKPTGSTPPVHEFYRQLDEEIDSRFGASVGFTSLIRMEPYTMDEQTVAGFRNRYDLVKRFQEQTLALFKSSLKGECDPEIAQMVVADLPRHLGLDYHRQLTDRQHRSPVFFRTDESRPGKLTEIQCPGSGWGMVEEIMTLYRNNEAVFGPSKHFYESLAAGFARAIGVYLGSQPLVHHFLGNSSRPHGMRYFIQRTREHGVRYFSYDQGCMPQDCNFIRSHDFISLPHHNFFAERMKSCNRREVFFDLSPSALFDGKIIMSWPFWHKTRDWYDDEVRALFPYTSVILPDGFELANGEHINIESFCRRPAGERNYYIKYAGSDIALNWGSRAVFLARGLSSVQCRKMFEDIATDSRRGRFWILQESIRHRERVSALARDGEPFKTTAYSKLNGFYGPNGLMAILVMHKKSQKVHGSPETIVSLVP